MSAPTQKDVIYIDIDDEITSIIDKVRSSNGALLALVLPKRATMLQSSVNMKLLKRAADSAKKNIVLITSETGLVSLAGTVGLYVAKTLQSKPELPTAAAKDLEPEFDELAASDETPEEGEFDSKEAAKKPIGDLATGAVAGAALASAEPDETIALDNSADDAVDKNSSDRKKGKDKKSKDKKLKVPNFERFRLKLILVALLIIILIVGWILANVILPKASIVIATKTSTVNSSLTLNLDTAAKTLDTTQLTVPAQTQQVAKTSSAQVTTTGQLNEGAKATGTVEITNCSSPSSPITIPAGTGVTANNLTYITQSAVTLPDSFASGNTCPSDFQSGGKFGANYSAAKVAVTALNGGSTYNSTDATPAGTGPTSGSTMNVPGNSSVEAASVTDMTNGSDSIVQTVSQSDIDSATQKIVAPDIAPIKTALQNDLQQAGLVAITATFNAGTPTNTPGAAVGTQATTVTVTQSITYTMLGVQKSYLQTLVDNDVNSKIDTSKQTIIDDGVSNATFTLLNTSANSAQVTMQTAASTGAKLNMASLKQQIAGKKSGDVKTIIEANPGVTNVTVKYSPFFVSSTPKNVSKITIQVEKSS